jgi:hypothetical protein
MGDETNFRRLGESVHVIELGYALKSEMNVVHDLDIPESPIDDSMGESAIDGAIERWNALHLFVLRETFYWVRVEKERSTVEDRWQWRRDELGRRNAASEPGTPPNPRG